MILDMARKRDELIDLLLSQHNQPPVEPPQPVTCDRCYQPFAEGDHGVGACPFERRNDRLHITPDDVPGGFWVEAAWSEPRKFYSHKEYRRALDADGMMIRDKGVRGNKDMPIWGHMDAQTLKNAEELVSRSSRVASDPVVALDTFSHTVKAHE